MVQFGYVLYGLWASGALVTRSLVAAQAGDTEWPVSSTGLTDSVEWDHYSYIINGERIFMFGGEMHPFRIPVPELWEDILQKMKAMGMNTMSFYSLWGYHEPIPGQLDWETGAHNLTRLLEVARDTGLFVSPRPGPYINVELNAGGFPMWLTTGAYGTLRENGTAYTNAWESYQSGIASLIAPFQIHRNGTVITYQIENELPNQWKSVSAKTPNPPYIAYMEELEANARSNGIQVPLTHNNPNTDESWSIEYDTVGAGGDVDIIGHDSYPLCWSCLTSQCSTSNPEFTLLDYLAYYEEYAPNQPSYIPEFQGGKVTPLTGYPDGCADTVGVEYRNLYYRHNIDQRITAMMSYMTFGGTSWGWLAVPFLGTSYDYSAPIAEDRTLRDTFYELKNLALFTRVAADLRKTDRIASGTNYTTSSLIQATELRNPDTNAGFYVVRHSNSTSDTPATFKVQLQTSVGLVTAPTYADGVSLDGHIAKIMVTDFAIGNESIIYSTAEVLTYAIIDGKTTVVLWSAAGEINEAYITGASVGRLLESPRASVYANVSFHQAGQGVILTFIQPAGLTVTQVGQVRVVIVDRSVANFIFVPALTNNPLVPTNETVIISGPYLVRGARIDSDTIYVTGDTVNATYIEVFAPEAVTKVSWNGRIIQSRRTSYGSLRATLAGPSIINVTLPALGPWKGQDSLPRSFPTSGTLPYLYNDDYGFHTGSFIYRGRFNGSATGVLLNVYGGEAAGFSVYLNGILVGASLSSASGSSTLNVTFPDSVVASNSSGDASYLLAIVADTSGHDESSGATTVRGIQNVTLVGATGGPSSGSFSSWKMAGTAGGSTGIYLDPIRGTYNEAGWQAERLGWHLPGFDDSAWPESAPSEGFQNATVRFYRTSAPLNIPDGHDVSIAFTFGNTGPNDAIRALLYVNGYQYGRYNPNVNDATTFPVPPGILNYDGENDIAVLVWAQSTSGAAVTLDWSITSIRESSFNPKIDASYLQPRWNATRLDYA